MHRQKQAGVAQLVERQPSKLNVASSNLVFRSAKEILDVIIKDFLLYRTARLIVDMSYKLYCCRHELQARASGGKRNAPAGVRRNKLHLYTGFTVIW